MSIASSAIAAVAIAGEPPVGAVNTNADSAETLAVAEAQDASAVMVAAQLESVADDTSQDASYGGAGGIAETAAIGASQQTSLSAVDDIAENVSCNETITALLASFAAISEANAAAENQSANSNFATTLLEPAAIVESQNGVLGSVEANSESISALDTALSQLASMGAMDEVGFVDTVQDSNFAALILADIVEGVAVSDSPTAFTFDDAIITETAALTAAAQVFKAMVNTIPHCPIVSADITTRAQADIITQVKTECC